MLKTASPCIPTNKCSIMPCMTTTIMKKRGKEYRTHKRYVDVLVRNTVDGQQIPYAVCWVDGRTFKIDEVIEVHGAWPSTSRDESKFSWVTRYDIRMGHHETEIYQERYPDNLNQGEGAYVRWWVCEIPHKRSGLVLRRTIRFAHVFLKPHVEFTEGALVALVLKVLQCNRGLLEAFLVLSRRDSTFGATKPCKSIMIDAFQKMAPTLQAIAPRTRGYIAKHST